MTNLTKYLPALYGHYEMRHEADHMDYWDQSKNRVMLRLQNANGLSMKPTACAAVNEMVSRHDAVIKHADNVAHMKNLPWLFGHITMPLPESFSAPHVYTHTVVHEMSHRARAMKYGPRQDLCGRSVAEAERSPGYIMEECEAELGAALVCAELDPDNAEYHLTRGAQYVGFFADGAAKTYVNAPNRAELFQQSLPSALERAAILLGDKQPEFDIEAWTMENMHMTLDQAKAELEADARMAGILDN